MIKPNTDCAHVARIAGLPADAYYCCTSCHEGATLPHRLFRGAEVKVCCMTTMHLPSQVKRAPKVEDDKVDLDD
jgi:hypothetical protein